MGDWFSVNKIILIGRIATEVVHNTTRKKQRSMVRFRLATNEAFVVDGEQRKKTQFHNIIAWGKTADYIKDYARKGLMIAIEGKARNSFYEKNGINMRNTQFEVFNFIPLESVKKQEEEYEEEEYEEEPEEEEETEEEEEKDDDIPF